MTQKRNTRDSYVHLTTRDSFWKFAECLQNRQAFATHGALYSEGPEMPGYWAQGQLDVVEYGASLAQADYVVYSYGTPIAWHLRGDYAADAGVEWVMPDEKYSLTTTRHQGKILVALNTFTEVR